MTASDPVVLDALYRTDAGLAARQAIYRWLRRPVDMPAEALAALRDVTGVVADIGCGNGAYVVRFGEERPDLRVLGVDLSVGMLATLGTTSPAHRALLAADAAALPLANASVDAALVMHMLYHLPEPAQGVAELRRVVAAGGLALVATNARDDKVEVTDLLARAFAEAGAGPLNREFGPHNDFSLEALVPPLGGHFGKVEVTEWHTEIAVPEVGAVVAYVDSVRPVVEPDLPGRVPWTSVLAATEVLVAQEVRDSGAFSINGHVGMAVCQ